MAGPENWIDMPMHCKRTKTENLSLRNTVEDQDMKKSQVDKKTRGLTRWSLMNQYSSTTNGRHGIGRSYTNGGQKETESVGAKLCG